jgi:hypothetical protein
MTTLEIANKIVENCTNGKFSENYKNFYAEDAIAYEPEGNAFQLERELKGHKKIVSRANAFHAIIEKLLSRTVSAPLVAGDYFTFRLCQEFELKNIGYFKLDELCLFQVKDGKITKEEYFY